MNNPKVSWPPESTNTKKQVEWNNLRSYNKSSKSKYWFFGFINSAFYFANDQT